MRNHKAVNIKELIETSDIAGIMRKGIFLNELNQRLQKIFPAQFSGLFRTVNFTRDSLNIEVASATVRQGLLFRQQEVLRLIQQEYPEIVTLNLKVNPDMGREIT